MCCYNLTLHGGSSLDIYVYMEGACIICIYRNIYYYNLALRGGSS
jgi:hypothetical protein